MMKCYIVLLMFCYIVLHVLVRTVTNIKACLELLFSIVRGGDVIYI